MTTAKKSNPAKTPKDHTDPLDCVCAHLRRTTRSVTALYDDILRPSGLRSTQFTLLHAVSLQNGAALVPLARQTGIDRTTLARSLETLAQNGLVTLTADKQDKRKMLATLTPTGRKAFETALPLWRKAQSQTLEVLSKKGWDKLYRRLNEIESTLNQPTKR